MGLISSLFTWPLAPVRGVVRLGELIQEQVERELHDPAVVRRELEAVEEARNEGRMTEEEAAQAMEEILARLTGLPGEGR
ncbi:gas vesicle protein G [Nonomuraea sp. KC401]|uniref:gas vesicle protein GvpG n=1 Tax=unclassified Nonomuraea TaxID=2593643 RepID=UPI0010FCDF1F|nr:MULTISPECIES: gas vesicle protein GvpG [unclassified Nonomuraea]NBE94620.1 gas vesicle protein G [Nonomuraea sp. K271]TLF72639.1 gas vesicle protein G [Nonomuraea sp. KC401]